LPERLGGAVRGDFGRVENQFAQNQPWLHGGMNRRLRHGCNPIGYSVFFNTFFIGTPPARYRDASRKAGEARGGL
jgi:hypothetical protein